MKISESEGAKSIERIGTKLSPHKTTFGINQPGAPRQPGTARDSSER